MADVFNEKDRTTAHSLPAFRRYQFRAAMCARCAMLTHDLLRNSNGIRESSCAARHPTVRRRVASPLNDAVQGR
jgi:hypothetical protein